MSTHHDPSKPVVVHPFPPQDPEPRWRLLARPVPPWTLVGLLPLAAVLAGGALGTIGTP